jgi:hypothetical protein
MTRFARVLGFARSGKPVVAKVEIIKLGQFRDKLQAAKDS